MRIRGEWLADDGKENPCFGRGPGNRHGLRLEFYDDGRTVRSELAPRPEFEGWPTNWNLGIAVTAAIETLGWALWERQGPSLLNGPMKVEDLGRLELARPLSLDAHRARRGPATVIVSTVRQRGRPVLRVTAPVAAMTPSQARRFLRSGSRVPRSMRAAFEARAEREPREPSGQRERPRREGTRHQGPATEGPQERVRRRPPRVPTSGPARRSR